MSTLAAAIAAIDESLAIVWVGELPGQSGTRAIVEHPDLGRRYLWPGMSAWRGSLPGVVADPLPDPQPLLATVDPGLLLSTSPPATPLRPAVAPGRAMVDREPDLAGQLSLF